MTLLVISVRFAWATTRAEHLSARAAEELAEDEAPERTKERTVVVRVQAPGRKQEEEEIEEAEDSRTTSGKMQAGITGSGDRDLIAIMGKIRTSMQSQ